MPKETFFNLKEEKKQRILQAALNEIAENGFEKAGVTRIVKEAGIATGSFYQYFDDLDDLFLFIATEAARLKTAYMRRAAEEVGRENLESCVRALYLGGLRFAVEHGEYLQATQRFLQIRDSALYQKMLERAEKSELTVWLYKIVNRAIANGEMAEGMTAELFFHLAANVNTTIIEYLLAKKPDGSLSREDLDALCELGTQILLHGVGKPEKETKR